MSEHNHLTRDIKPEGQCPACDNYHKDHEDLCYSCGKKEIPAENDFLKCGECFHIFRTEQELIALDWFGPGSPTEIYACPLCAHDF